jgi:hypothetical protein
LIVVSLDIVLMLASPLFILRLVSLLGVDDLWLTGGPDSSHDRELLASVLGRSLRIAERMLFAAQTP